MLRHTWKGLHTYDSQEVLRNPKYAFTSAVVAREMRAADLCFDNFTQATGTCTLPYLDPCYARLGLAQFRRHGGIASSQKSNTKCFSSCQNNFPANLCSFSDGSA